MGNIIKLCKDKFLEVKNNKNSIEQISMLSSDTIESNRYILKRNIEIEVLEDTNNKIVYRDNTGSLITIDHSVFNEEVKIIKTTRDRKVKAKRVAEKNFEQAITNHNERYKRYDEILKQGCIDPFHSDGTNLALIRNHIKYFKGKIKNLGEMYEFDIPKCYYKELPEKVSLNYMAREEELLAYKEDMKAILDNNCTLIERAQSYLDNLLNKNVLEYSKIEKTTTELARLARDIQCGTLVEIRRVKNRTTQSINGLIEKLDSLLKLDMNTSNTKEVHSDGTNLPVIRNHIRYKNGKIKNTANIEEVEVSNITIKIEDNFKKEYSAVKNGQLTFF